MEIIQSKNPGPRRRPAPIGQKFNALTIIKEIEPIRDKNRRVFIRRVIAKCDCGREDIFRLQQIVSRQYKSCGHLTKNKWQDLMDLSKINFQND